MSVFITQRWINLWYKCSLVSFFLSFSLSLTKPIWTLKTRYFEVTKLIIYKSPKMLAAVMLTHWVQDVQYAPQNNLPQKGPYSIHSSPLEPAIFLVEILLLSSFRRTSGHVPPTAWVWCILKAPHMMVSAPNSRPPQHLTIPSNPYFKPSVCHRHGTGTFLKFIIRDMTSESTFENSQDPLVCSMTAGAIILH